MSSAAAEPLDSSARINFSWLVKLRWATIFGQALTVLLVSGWLHIKLPLVPLGALIAFAALLNLGLTLWLGSHPPIRPAISTCVMIFDVLILTALLYYTGGPLNPFSFLYLVQIALAVLVLEPLWTWVLVGLSLVCSGVLFFFHRELPLGNLTHGSHESSLVNLHLNGMWIAFGVAATFIVYFLLRVTRALAGRDQQILAMRDAAARQQTLVSLATLAAGAAHELSTPLSTIAVVARELERALDAEAGSPAVLADVRLIRDQVARCRTILDQMAQDVGESRGETPETVQVADLLAALRQSVGPAPRLQVEAPPEVGARLLVVPVRALVQAIQGLVKNAEDASSVRDQVVLRAMADEQSMRLEIRDQGRGMAPEVLARAGEPFFTTKSPGRGMGLGLFLARSMLERLGGQLRLESAAERGTVATVILPCSPAHG